MRDMSADLASLNADWRALRDAAESLDCGAPDVWTMLLIELRAIRELLTSAPNNDNAVRVDQP